MRFTALASSSAGNAYIVDDSETRILLECGISHRKLKQLSGFSLSQFSACLVSHEHKDHAKAVQELIKDGMTIYMSEGTADALETDCVSLCAALEQFNVGSLDIVPFATFHDAAEPLGFLIKSRVDGDVLAFATPIYYYEMCGQMKTLLDRLNPLFPFDYAFRDVYMIATAAEDEDSAFEKAYSGLQGWVDCFGKAELKGIVTGSGIADPNDAGNHKDAMQKAYELGKSL